MIHVCVSEKHLSGVEAGSVASPLISTRVKGRLGTVRGGTPGDARYRDTRCRHCGAFLLPNTQHVRKCVFLALTDSKTSTFCSVGG